MIRVKLVCKTLTMRTCFLLLLLVVPEVAYPQLSSQSNSSQIQLKLKKLITTCYKNCDADLFSKHMDERGIYLEYDGDKSGNIFQRDLFAALKAPKSVIQER